jgi:NAD(P)H-dependent FMN reductase
MNLPKKRNDGGIEYEIVALADYDLPLLGAKLPEDRQAAAGAAIQAWSEKMASFDGYVFVTPEYNHAVGGALKNALDFLKPEVADKAAGFVGYGSLGGARARRKYARHPWRVERSNCAHNSEFLIDD